MKKERLIKKVGNQAVSIRQMMDMLNYKSNHPGSGTSQMFKRILGEQTYSEIASGRRKKLPKSRWTRVKIYNRK